MENFVNLRTHTNFSLSEGMLTSDYISKFCRNDMQPACAITDTSNLFGAFEFSEKLFSNGVQPIIGMQLNIYDDYLEKRAFEVVILSKNLIGYQNLVKLSNLVNKSINLNITKKIYIDTLLSHNDGLILLSGGMIRGFAGKPANDGEYDICYKRIEKLKSVFKNNLYIEIQRANKNKFFNGEKILINISIDLNIPIVATNDAFFKNKNQFGAFEILKMIDNGQTISTKKESLVTQENYLKTKTEMIELFDDLPEAIENSIIIAKKCSFYLKPTKLTLPKFSNTVSISEDKIIKELSEKGLNIRLDENGINLSSKKALIYFERLEKELEIIINMGFSGYFLIVSDFVKWSKLNDIPVGPGRGSGAGSIVAWSLQITDLDPLKWGLLFERFLNPERVSMPDFDIDFCQDRRDEVINYIKEKYGSEYVAQIITFGSLQARAAIRDVGRVLEMPYGQVDKIAKLIPSVPANPITLSKALETEDELIKSKEDNEEIANLINLSLSIEGLNRHVSTHAAGIVISQKKLNEFIPLYSEVENEIPATQFNLKYIEKAGLVKFDILGLKTLTIISKAEKLVKESNKDFNISKVSLYDKKVFQMLSDGFTVGIFQLESKGMQNALRGLKPDRFEDIIAVVALYRPGPMENIPSYINRKHKKEKIKYIHEKLSNILSETYGIFIYQEQVMQAAQVLAGYSLASADILRRAMGKKDKVEMQMQKEVFLKGVQNIGISVEDGEEIFDQIAAFAGYGFNKSHAAAYALIAYQCAWLKTYFPHEFFSALMTYESDNTDKLLVLVNELKRMGIKVLEPNLNKSYDYFAIEKINDKEKSLRYSLSSLKNVGTEAVKKMIEIRSNKKFFNNIDNFIEGFSQNNFGKRGLESLVKSGSFDCFEINRSTLFESIQQILNYSQRIQIDKLNKQNNLFNNIEELNLSKSFVNIPEWSLIDFEKNELSSIGFYLNKHPLNRYKNIYQKMNLKSTSFFNRETSKHTKNEFFKMIGIVNSIYKRKSQMGGFYGVLELNDFEGVVEVFIDDNNLKFIEENYDNNEIFYFYLELKSDGNFGHRINCRGVFNFFDILSKEIFNLEIYINDVTALKYLKKLVSVTKRGTTNLSIVIISDNKKLNIDLNKNIKLTSNFISELSKMRGISNFNLI